MKKVIVDTRGEHVRFSFLKHNYTNHLFATENHVGDDAHITYHRQFGLKTFFVLCCHYHIYGQKWDLCRYCLH